jgi:hypothetical protein
MTTRRRLLTVAHHEAGHAVIGLALGAGVKQIAIGLVGHVDFDFDPISDPKALLSIIVAGLVAELLHHSEVETAGSQNDLSSLGNPTKIARLIRSLVNESGTPDDETFTSGFTTSDLADAVTGVKAILREYGNVHAGLVAALMAKGWMTSEEVTRVFNRGVHAAGADDQHLAVGEKRNHDERTTRTTRTTD